MIEIDGLPEARHKRNLPGLREYRKTATVQAVEMDEPFSVRTMEGTMEGKPGDYLCVGPAGEAWPVNGEIFLSTYEPVSEWENC